QHIELRLRTRRRCWSSFRSPTERDEVVWMSIRRAKHVLVFGNDPFEIQFKHALKQRNPGAFDLIHVPQAGIGGNTREQATQFLFSVYELFSAVNCNLRREKTGR